MKENLGFAVIGCGVVGHKHAEEIASLAGSQLVGVADILPDRAREVGERYGARWFADYRELLQLPAVDIVTVCVPSGLHALVAVDAARAGKHLIVEKPIDVTLAQANWLISEAHQAGVVLSVVSQHRFDPSTVRVKQEIEAGRLGKLFLGQVSVFWYRSQGYYDSGEWRGTWSLDGGGALINQSIHTVDLLQYFMGSVSEVYAHTGTYAHSLEVEDAAISTVKFRQGGLATVAVTTAAYPGLSARIEVFGDQGSAIIDGDRLTHLYRMDHTVQGIQRMVDAPNLAVPDLDNNASERPLWIQSSAHRKQFMDVMEAVRLGRKPLVTGEEGRNVLEIILAIYQSGRTGHPVQLPLST